MAPGQLDVSIVIHNVCRVCSASLRSRAGVHEQNYKTIEEQSASMLFLKIYYYMGMSALPECLYLQLVHAWYPQRHKEALKSSGTGVADGWRRASLPANHLASPPV